MDRSYLSQPEVIAASRQFVCVRLATYEDAEEGAFLKALVPTRSGELENSVFAILSPDGNDNLVRASRGIRHVYVDSRAMAEGMDQIARHLAAKSEPSALPLV